MLLDPIINMSEAVLIFLCEKWSRKFYHKYCLKEIRGDREEHRKNGERKKKDGRMKEKKKIETGESLERMEMRGAYCRDVLLIIVVNVHMLLFLLVN